MKTLAIFHMSGVSGPSKTLFPSLERLASRGSLEVLVPQSAQPLPGTVARQYAEIATVSAARYAPLTAPGSAAQLAASAIARGRELVAFRTAIRRARPDLLVVATSAIPSAVLAGRCARVPTIVRVAEIFDKGHVGGPARSLGGRALSTLLRRCSDAVVCSSNAVAAQFRGPGRASVTRIYPGIGDEHARGDGGQLRRRLGLEDAAPLVAVVGNITAGRGQDVAIRALERLLRIHPGARLLLAGAAHDRQADREFEQGLRDLALSLGVGEAVAHAGFVEPVADAYAAADVVVNPARFNEPFGRAALEALVADVPVVATRVGAIPEVLRHEVDALLVGPDDAVALAAALDRLVAEPALARRLAAAGRERVLAEFATERVADEFERVADAVLAAAGRGGAVD